MEPSGLTLQLSGGLRRGLTDQVQADAKAPQLGLRLFREGPPQW